MTRGLFRTDLGLVDQGIELGLDFGIHSVVELARLGELLLHSVYERGSLRLDGGQAVFTLRNPPLRMGAFSRVRLFWDGAEVPAAAVSIAPALGTPRALAEVDREHPVTIPVGERTRFRLGPVPSDAHRHVVRLELQSVAIPPTVWFEFSDVLGAEPGR
jgi:hypothetical protein